MAQHGPHDYKRNGTTTLFAALNVAVIGECMPRHRHREFLLRFLKTIDERTRYVWTKTAAEIFSKVARAKQALESQH